MSKYDEVKELKLTVGQMLSVLIFLYDAQVQNEEKDRPRTAQDVKELGELIRGQCEGWIDEAAKEVDERMEAKARASRFAEEGS